jgi:hypothetical protein
MQSSESKWTRSNNTHLRLSETHSTANRIDVTPKTASSRKGLRLLQTTFCLAKEMVENLGSSPLLQRTLSNGSASSSKATEGRGKTDRRIIIEDLSEQAHRLQKQKYLQTT